MKVVTPVMLALACVCVSAHAEDPKQLLDCPDAYLQSWMETRENPSQGTGYASLCVFDGGDKAIVVLQGYFQTQSTLTRILKLGMDVSYTEKRLYKHFMEYAALKHWSIVETKAEGKGLLFE